MSLTDRDIPLWAQGVGCHFDSRVKIAEPAVSPLQAQGPKSFLLMRKLCGDWIDELRYYWLRETDTKGISVLTSRTGRSSELGYEIFLLDGSAGDDLWEYIFGSYSALQDTSAMSPVLYIQLGWRKILRCHRRYRARRDRYRAECRIRANKQCREDR